MIVRGLTVILIGLCLLVAESEYHIATMFGPSEVHPLPFGVAGRNFSCGPM